MPLAARTAGWRPGLRSAMRTATAEQGRQVWKDAREAHLVSLRDSFQCTLDELVQLEQLRERYVRGPDGRPVPHTSAYLLNPELPYEQHADNVADIHSVWGWTRVVAGPPPLNL